MNEAFCGCCGCEISFGDWCLRCQQHVMERGAPPWDRTYMAQPGVECPYADVTWHKRIVKRGEDK